MEAGTVPDTLCEAARCKWARPAMLVRELVPSTSCGIDTSSAILPIAYAARGTDRHRELETPLQRHPTARIAGLQTAGARSVRACPCRVAVCAH